MKRISEDEVFQIIDERDMFKNILDSMEEGYVVQDSSGKIIRFNAAACRILGLTADQLVGKTSMDPCWQAIRADETPYEGEEHPAMITLRTGQAQKDKLMGIRSTLPSIRWLQINTVPILITGNEVAVLVTFSNVTEHIEVKKYLMESESQLQEAQEVAQIGSWSYNPATDLATWTPQMYHLFPENIADGPPDFKRHISTIHPDDQEHFSESVKQCLTDGRSFKSRYRSVFPDGRICWVETKGRGHRDADGKVSYIFGTCQDINSQIMLERSVEVERSKSLHNSKLASLGELSAGIAHEINNPLNIISSSVVLLERYRDNNEKFKSKLEVIQRSIYRITKIINGLKKFSRSSDRSQLKPNNLRSIIDEAKVLTEMKAKQTATEVSFDFKDDPFINCEEIEIEQVIVNLVNNAIDAVKGTEPRWVKVVLFSLNDKAIIQVIDSGAGISEEHKKRIFDPFFTTKPVGEGTGLGLSITKGILDDHKATIDVKKVDGHNCFEVVFSKLSMKNLMSA